MDTDSRIGGVPSSFQEASWITYIDTYVFFLKGLLRKQICTFWQSDTKNVLDYMAGRSRYRVTKKFMQKKIENFFLIYYLLKKFFVISYVGNVSSTNALLKIFLIIFRIFRSSLIFSISTINIVENLNYIWLLGK